MQEIIGEELCLSNIENRMNEERFSDLRACVEEFKKNIADVKLREMFEKTFFNTLYTTTFLKKMVRCLS